MVVRKHWRCVCGLFLAKAKEPALFWINQLPRHWRRYLSHNYALWHIYDIALFGYFLYIWNVFIDNIFIRDNIFISLTLKEMCYITLFFLWQQVEEYLLDQTRTKPLVLHGASGTGKTSVMAMAAKMASKWLKKPAVIVLRFES